jgi:hypothetical protein
VLARSEQIADGLIHCKSMEVAFVTDLERLPPRQRALLAPATVTDGARAVS